MDERVGATVVELVVALLVGLLVLNLSLRTLASARRLARTLLDRVEAVETVRTARVVLRRELRRAQPGVDWQPHPPDSVTLRAFRGVGLACPGTHAAERLTVRWRGSRRPDPAKDSVLALLADGTSVAYDLVADAPSAACALDPSTTARRWTLDRTPEHRVVAARLYERGSYHVSGHALRYRPGASGRQPLTPESLETPGSGFHGAGDPLTLTLAGRGTAAWGWSGTIAPRR